MIAYTLYNTLTVFAPELRASGALPRYRIRREDGTIDHRPARDSGVIPQARKTGKRPGSLSNGGRGGNPDPLCPGSGSFDGGGGAIQPPTRKPCATCPGPWKTTSSSEAQLQWVRGVPRLRRPHGGAPPDNAFRKVVENKRRFRKPSWITTG